MGIPITMTDLKFMRFIAKEIFPGGAVPCDEDIVEYSGDAGFSVEQSSYLTSTMSGRLIPGRRISKPLATKRSLPPPTRSTSAI